MHHVTSLVARYAIPLVVVIARLICNEGLSELERALQSIARKAAESFLATQAAR